MSPRANWKGFLKIAELSCAVGLYSAVSQSERVSFHTVSRTSGHRLNRLFVDEETGEEVPRDQQVKGYETGNGDYVVLEPEEIAAAVPDSDKTLDISAFIACADIDLVYFDRPYYLAPTDDVAAKVFALIRAGMEAKKVAAVARTVLFRRVRTVLLRPYEAGMIATTLNFDYEVRAAAEAFSQVPAFKVKGEMLDLAKHIIATKAGSFDPHAFEDRYEAAVVDLVRAKLEGRKIARPKAAAKSNVVNLLDALRASAGGGGGARDGAKGGTKDGAKAGVKALPKSADPAKGGAKSSAKTKASKAGPTKTGSTKTGSTKAGPARKAG
ncbi:MAG TPA: Ku protein [Xanthobacteraceae bacterium]|uniref:non-homologous end joining protein Ku n=1 Tax=Roseixanthobacter finlandensis TaxID=3119922 RepID=UPI000BDD2181|nr:MAG: Ku protein [Rhizobiales bacterium 39-66-18]HQS07869.1 Ku protein [Xanthobacteraceae bacterium]HQS49212.1 Ku protein [Xanthobacteraceae bacterium]